MSGKEERMHSPRSLETREKEERWEHLEKMATLGELSAGLVHDIRNPLAYVKSNLSTLHGYLKWVGALVQVYHRLEQLREKGGGEEEEALLQDLHKLHQQEELAFVLEDLMELPGDCLEGVERVSGLVGELSSFIRKEEAEEEMSDLNEELKGALAMAQLQRKRGVEVCQDLASLPEIRCVKGAFSRVFLNLITNGMQAMEEGGTLFVRSRFQNGGITVEVEDEGKGIPSDKLEKIFDPFFTTKPEGKGTGLGLSICQKILKEHGGEIRVESEEGKGSCFSLHLPLEGRGEKK